MTELQEVFAKDGLLADVIDGYLPREAQLEMAQSIFSAIQSKSNLIAEAGTGTGKTFAYLVPAILSGKKTIVSTGTKNLQDQLFAKDLPIIKQALAKLPFKAALLKGRSNYLCTYRLDASLKNSFGYSKEDAQALAQIKTWSKQTRVGDITEVSDIRENEAIWSFATSTVDNCLGQECPDFSDCFLLKARKKAQDADLVVVNHHLLCADWSIRETGFGELLPSVEVIVLDEAHQLAETASGFLGINLGAKQLNDLATDSITEFLDEAKDMPDLRQAAEDVQYEVKNVRMAFGMELKRGEWQDIEQNPKLISAIKTLHEQLQRLTDQLEMASVRSKGLEACFERCETYEAQLDSLLNDRQGEWIKWYEIHSKSFTLSRTPLDIAKEFKSFMQQHLASWIFTSATLSVASDFKHFADMLGLQDAQKQSWLSPFDYPDQSLFYHPKGLPKPAEADFTDKIIEFVIPVLQASQGRAFFLFTSHRALQRAADILQDRVDYPLLVQGSKSKAVLLDDFKQKGDAVLLATASFWEGVDVRGDALSCVIIDKLPFSSPGDPVLKARLNAIEQKGGNPFFQYQLPTAVIALRQGVGRLIRDVQDRGVLMVCDPRLLKRAYGQIFLDSLPDMRRTRDIAEVEAFFKKEQA